MRAIVVDEAGAPRLDEVPEPDGEGELVRILACGLCGSDVEKLTPAHAGAVLGHEVAARAADGSRVVLLHHRPCGRCERCRAGHESTCEAFAAPTIRPGGFAERARSVEAVPVANAVPDAVATYAEPLACVLRGARRVPSGRVLVVGQGFVGTLFAAVLRRRGDEVFAVDARPERSGPEPDGPVDAAVLCAPGGADAAVRAVVPGGTVLVFADAGIAAARRRLPARALPRRLALSHAARRSPRRSPSSPSSTCPRRRCSPSSASRKGWSCTGAARR